MILKKRLDETIHDKFIEDLYTGRYHAGERIDPAEMAMECSISRTPVVQALKQLANEKVLTVSNGGKFFMVIPDQKMLDDVCDVRCLLEQHAISIHLKNYNREALIQLKEMVMETQRKQNAGDVVGGTKNNLEFHKRFVELTGNRCLLETYLPILYQYGGIKYSLGNQWESHMFLEGWHLKIIDFLIDQDEEEAKKATWEHIDMCRRDISRRIG